MKGPRANPPQVDPNEWECWVDEGHVWGVGSFHRFNPYDANLDEADEWALYDELKAKEARRVPLGFRAETSAGDIGAGGFPVVGRLTIEGA
jgi:hypothetical protein